MRTRQELEGALRALGRELDGPERTAGGWKAMIRRSTVSMLATGSNVEEVLQDLLPNAAIGDSGMTFHAVMIS